MVTFSISLIIYDVVKRKHYTVSANSEVDYAEDSNTSAHGFSCEQRCNVALRAPYGRSLNQLSFAIVTFCDEDGNKPVWGTNENPVMCVPSVEKEGVILQFSRQSQHSLFI